MKISKVKNMFVNVYTLSQSAPFAVLLQLEIYSVSKWTICQLCLKAQKFPSVLWLMYTVPTPYRIMALPQLHIGSFLTVPPIAVTAQNTLTVYLKIPSLPYSEMLHFNTFIISNNNKVLELKIQASFITVITVKHNKSNVYVGVILTTCLKPTSQPISQCHRSAHQLLQANHCDFSIA
jgi:hypothetical protein